MKRYSVQPRNKISIKGYGFLSFATNMGENIGKNISKCKYSEKLLDHTKQSATDALKTSSKTAIQKTSEATGDLTRNIIGYKIARASKTSPKL